ncbi:MAG: lamin tail domain-containing protein [Verrucomicrobia bacterium]|nr:lamin tail domain-containing protein [Verrucomicrobiota bacterium]
MNNKTIQNLCFRFLYPCFCVLLAVGAFAQEILISEFVAVNEASLTDGEGDEPDWIELKNTGYSSVDLTGWHLTDDAGDLNKWTLLV